MTPRDAPLLIVSVDTEEDQWHPTRQDLSATNLRELPRLASLLERLGVRATYFVTYQAARSAAAAAVRDATAGGRGEIGAHLHPWNTPPMDEAFAPENWMLNNLAATLQQAKLTQLTETLEERFAVRPTVFRAGRFGLGGATIDVLQRCGYGVDSSVTPYWNWTATDRGPDFRGAPVNVYRVGSEDVCRPRSGSPVIEVPLSSGFTGAALSRWDGLGRWLETPPARMLHVAGLAARIGHVKRTILSPETDTVPDMLELSRRLLEGGARHLHLFFHSSSLRPGLTPFAQTAADVDRLYRRIEEYVDGLAALTAVRPCTVGEAAAQFAEVGAPQSPSVAAPSVRRRLLVVTYHLPPDGAVGGLRWAGLGKNLSALGWQVRVVTAALGESGAATRGIAAERCPRGRTLNDRYNALVTRLRRRDPAVVSTAALSSAARRSWLALALARLRAEIAAWLALPDHGRGWVLRAAARTRRIVRQWQPDVVVSSGPPHSAHLAVLLGTLGLSVRRVVDMRDPWAATGVLPGRWDPVQATWSARRLIPLLERLVLRRASGVITNTPELAERLRDRHPGLTVACVPNGVDRERLPQQPSPTYAGVSLAYVGTLYGDRSLAPVLDALKCLVQRYPAARADSRLRIAGHADARHARDLAQDLEQRGLRGIVEHLGLLSEAGALELVARSQLAIVLAQDQPLQVPAKLYESIGLGVPTLVLTELESATAREGRRLGAQVLEPGNVVEIAGLLERLWTRGPLAPPTTGAMLSYTRLAVEMDSLLGAAVFPSGAASSSR